MTHERKKIYEKQHKHDKRYIRRLKKPEVKKYRYYSESKIESEPEAYYNYCYVESHRKPFCLKRKQKERDVTHSRKKTKKQKKRKKKTKAKTRMTIEK